MRPTLAVTVMALLSGATPGWAASPEGVFRRGGPAPLSATIFALDGREDLAGRFTTGFPDDSLRCGGSFAALGHREGNGRIVFTSKPKDGTTCRLTMTFSPGFAQARMDEDGCADFHGTSCDLVGTVRRTGR